MTVIYVLLIIVAFVSAVVMAADHRDQTEALKAAKKLKGRKRASKMRLPIEITMGQKLTDEDLAEMESMFGDAGNSPEDYK